MNSLQLQDSFVNLAKDLFEVFSCYIVRRLLLCSQRKTITSYIRLSGLKIIFPCIHRFLCQFCVCHWATLPERMSLNTSSVITGL
ncbi:MAG: hypothetical protein ACUVTN_08125 [Thermodesulfobacteriota bacterium]